MANLMQHHNMDQWTNKIKQTSECKCMDKWIITVSKQSFGTCFKQKESKLTIQLLLMETYMKTNNV